MIVKMFPGSLRQVWWKIWGSSDLLTSPCCSYYRLIVFLLCVFRLQVHMLNGALLALMFPVVNTRLVSKPVSLSKPQILFWKTSALIFASSCSASEVNTGMCLVQSPYISFFDSLTGEQVLSLSFSKFRTSFFFFLSPPLSDVLNKCSSSTRAWIWRITFQHPGAQMSDPSGWKCKHDWWWKTAVLVKGNLSSDSATPPSQKGSD